ncbi:alpha/beta hydrolase [Halobacteriovorax sp. HFRX-2_2]|uniref:alpha/beta fold hydrolase n=1 Tax=unclassified Halobacteriovorax TaxID=2639665 RepID=UPI00371449F2
MNWLLLRGLARDSRHWYEFPEYVEKMKGTQKVFAIDYLGVGSKNEEKSPLKISDYVEDMRDEWLKLKEENEGPWSVIGISMGGMMALDWCERHADDFEHAVLLNTSTSDSGKIYHRMSIEAMRTFSKLVFNKDHRERERKALSLTVKMKELSDDLLDAYAAYFEERPLNRVNFVRQLIAASHYRLPKKIKADILLLAGKQDKLANYKCSVEISKRLGATLELHEQAGHDLPIDDPEWIIKKIEEHYFDSK